MDISLNISSKTALTWLTEDNINDKSMLIQVTVWRSQATGHYRGQCWPRSMLPYSITRPQWVKYHVWWWNLLSQKHHQPWYWLYEMRMLSSSLRVKLNNLWCLIEEWYENPNTILYFLKITRIKLTRSCVGFKSSPITFMATTPTWKSAKVQIQVLYWHIHMKEDNKACLAAAIAGTIIYWYPVM